VASAYRSAQGGCDFISTSWAHKIRTRLVLWTPKTEVPQNKIADLDDIANCVSISSSVNVPQLIGSLDAAIFVPMYNWSKYQNCIEGNHSNAPFQI